MTQARIVAGRYELREFLGRGAAGVVWRAYDTRLQRFVALKLLPLGRVAEPPARPGDALPPARSPAPQRDPSPFLSEEFYEREGVAMARINSPYVATIFDQGVEQTPGGPELYLVMELINGRPLTYRMGNGQRLTLPQTVRWMRQICLGLSAAHSEGVVHRDIKPGNIMITDDDDVRIVDFGLSRFTDATASNRPGHSPWYAAPERWRHDSGDHRTDLYSLGCVLYEMLTGHPPFGSRNTSTEAVMRMHLDERPKPPRDMRPGIPDPLDRLTMHLLAKAPGDRPVDAQAVIKVVDEVERTPGGDAGKPPEPPGASSTPHVNPDFVQLIQNAELLIRKNTFAHGPQHPSALDARAEHARLTGRSGDARGAAVLYQRLGEDCQQYFGQFSQRALNAFAEVSRWVAATG